MCGNAYPLTSITSGMVRTVKHRSDLSVRVVFSGTVPADTSTPAREIREELDRRGVAYQRVRVGGGGLPPGHADAEMGGLVQPEGTHYNGEVTLGFEADREDLNVVFRTLRQALGRGFITHNIVEEFVFAREL